MDLLGIKRRRKEKQFNQELNLAINQELNYFGEATLEHFKAYHELAHIADSKINPSYEKTNYQQQAGVSAEVKNVARTNADHIMNKSDVRIARTDNIGKVHHQQFDYVLVDKNNNPILDSNGNFVGGTQQKNFSSVQNYDKLLGKEYEHYKNAKIAVPPDQYNDIIQRWNDKIDSYKQQIEYLKNNGNKDTVAELEKRIKQIEDVKSRTTPSKVSTTDAMEARKSPLLSTVEDIGRVSHRAGVESMKYGVFFGAGISAPSNIYSVVKGEKTVGEATVDITIDTGKAAAVSYATGAFAAAIGGALKATGNKICQTLSKGSGPAAIVNTGIILAKNTTSLVCGKITPEQYVKNIGQEGTTLAASMTGANLGAMLGTLIVPGLGSVVGGVVGGMVASLMSGAMHAELLKTIEDTKMSNEHRRFIAEYCKELKAQEIEYRERVCFCLDYFLDQKESQIKSSFEAISLAIENGDSIHHGLLQLSTALNQELAFASADEFKKHMESGKTLHL